MKKILFLFIFALILTGCTQEEQLSGFSDPFISLQLATDTDDGTNAGNVLITDGTNNIWSDSIGTSENRLSEIWASSTHVTNLYATTSEIETITGSLAVSTTTVSGDFTVQDSDGTDTLYVDNNNASVIITGTTTIDSTTLVVNPNENRVGIGTASPGAQLSVEGQGGAAFVVSDATNNTDFIVEGGGDVGIGGIPLVYDLEVIRSGQSNMALRDSVTDEFTVLTQSATDGDFLISRAGTGGSDFGIQADGDTYLGMFGNVGIGTAGPASALQVIGTTIATTVSLGSNSFVGDPTANSRSGTFSLSDGTGNNFGIGLGASDGSKYPIWFQTGNNNGGGFEWYIGTSEKMRIDKSGNVGIGTTTPAAKLVVDGDIQGSVYYGEFYAKNNADPTTINVAGVYEVVRENALSGLLNGMTHANGTTTATYQGVYSANAASAAMGGNNNKAHFQIAVNSVAQDNCHTARKLAAADLGAWSVTCLLDLEAGDEVTLEVENTASTDDITVADYNLNLVYIGLGD